MGPSLEGMPAVRDVGLMRIDCNQQVITIACICHNIILMEMSQKPIHFSAQHCCVCHFRRVGKAHAAADTGSPNPIGDARCLDELCVQQESECHLHSLFKVYRCESNGP
mmetsp:Transcript_138933/g.432225  ORF Transcript_138933/g.432225 Transcript_138933/m.432225 type:complete len:109 (-) Transcript_138933:931-1257(-)